MTRIDEGRGRLWLIVIFGLVLFAVSITPIRSYDYFWHLATGQWIVEHGTLPDRDPFTLSSDAIRWIDGEWLFQIQAALVHAVFGETGTSVARGLIVSLIFTIGFAVMIRRTDPTVALLVVSISVWGADHRLTTRPETIATLLIVVAVWLLLDRRPSGRVLVAYSVLTTAWMAIHPSALLAPALVGLVLVGRFVAGEEKKDLAMRIATGLASAASLLINPWGIEGVIAPLRLARLAGSGAFVNMEWTTTRFTDFPLVYIVIGAAAILFVVRAKWRDDAARILVFAFLAVLAVRYVRNHGFMFAALPILFASLIPMPSRQRVRIVVAAAAAVLLVGLVVRHGGIRVGVDESQFPVASVAYLNGLGLEGNVYNPDQLGGYLISRFYPERRVLTDGRNELHVSYIEEYSKARLDQRAWNALIARYGLVLAIDEYHRETVDVVDAVTGARRKLPASLIYFPRNDWALIGFDDVAMVFARRDSFNSEMLNRIEFRALVPDGAIPVVDPSPATIELAKKEIARARTLFGSQATIERIAMMLGSVEGGD